MRVSRFFIDRELIQNIRFESNTYLICKMQLKLMNIEREREKEDQKDQLKPAIRRADSRFSVG